MHTFVSKSQSCTHTHISQDRKWNLNVSAQTIRIKQRLPCPSRFDERSQDAAATLPDFSKTANPSNQRLTKPHAKMNQSLLKTPSYITYRAAAPEMISINSFVMTACRVRLNVNVSLSIISAANKRKGINRQLTRKEYFRLNWRASATF